MPIKLQCPQCMTMSAAPDGQVGRFVRCKRCNTRFPIPHGAPTLAGALSAVGRASVPPESPAFIDRYEVRELLGVGAFGSVYRAFDPKLGREVALKVLRREMTSSPQAVERFLREAKAAAKLNHPHIVAVFDADRAGDVYFIASAFIKGGTLASSVPETGMEPRRAAELAAQLASALGYAHRQGVVHRDVKPANILLDEHGSLQLMDFGLAGWTQDECTRLTRQGAVMGTPAYMAPEQALGDMRNVGPAADLYSAGVVLYELLTGRRPFDGGHPTALMYQIVHSEPTRPSEHRANPDAGLEAICLKAMAKKPADRFADGEAMAAALRAWTPTAIRMAVPIATPVPGGLPTWMGNGGKETGDFQFSQSNQARPTATILGGYRSRLSTVAANRFGAKWKLSAGSFFVILLAVVSAATVIGLFPPHKPSPSPGQVQTQSLTLGKGDELEDQITNTAGMKLRRIKAGKFLMGSPQEEIGRFFDEGPQHEIEITHDFYMGVNPVTRGQFAAFVQTVGYKTDAEGNQRGWGYNAAIRQESQDTKYTWRDAGFAQTDQHPVVNVTWNDAEKYCEWLSDKEHKTYELPTEAEWEYACRAGTTTRFWCGDLDEDLRGNANLGDSSLRDKLDVDFAELLTFVAWNDGYAFTSPAEKYKANRWRLYDMHGNVWQWCSDVYGRYEKDHTKDPEGANNGVRRVLRGGSWGSYPRNCRSANRNKRDPVLCDDTVGFRVVWRIPATTP